MKNHLMKSIIGGNMFFGLVWGTAYVAHIMEMGGQWWTIPLTITVSILSFIILAFTVVEFSLHIVGD